MATSMHLRCHCGLIYEPDSLLSSSNLPLDCNICHCNTCRYHTGALGTWYVRLKGSPSAQSMSNATAYKTSENLTRFFCEHCGCNAFVYVNSDDRWLACAGIVEPGLQGAENGTKDDNHKDVGKVEYHEYVGDAHDGGIAPYLTQLGGRDVPCFATDPQDGAPAMSEVELRALRDQGLDTASRGRGEAMEVACHCGAVQLRIAPPAHNENSEGWSCRLTLGFSLQPWMYIPPGQIFTADDQSVIFGPKAKETVQVERLKHYQSSDAVLRSFCTTCGATVFYQSFERPDIIDVSVGVVRSRAGSALAGEWLQWDRAAVSMRHEAVDRELVEAWLGN